MVFGGFFVLLEEDWCFCQTRETIALFD